MSAETATVDQSAETSPTCYENIVAVTTNSPARLGFEFDLNYGASTVKPPLDPTEAGWGATVFPLEGKNITTHRIKKEGFRLEGDGNRIEIGTKPFEVTASGRDEMEDVMKKVLALVTDLKDHCRAAKPDSALGFPAATGAPRHFTLPTLEARVASVFPLAFNRSKSYYASGCALGAAPQATFDLPLARIDQFVAIIESSEKKMVAGRAFSGPPGTRQGVRSVALYDARKAVNASRKAHLKSRTTLSDRTIVTETNFSQTLQGLLILMVSYLRTSELTYARNDYEIFAKAYLPLNSKNPFRLLFADLSTPERQVFTELYDAPRLNLWRLAKPGAVASDGDTKLFPDRTHAHQSCWFDPIPTWNDFVEKTVSNTPLLRTEHCPGKDKKGEDVGCEVLFAPLSRILPHETGSGRVTVEMRRLGHNWVFSDGLDQDGVHYPGWSEMTGTLFDLALLMNK
ncbi:MAG: hypothetical protein ABJD07_00535 [Gemmatimonadaceae bacterium]